MTSAKISLRCNEIISEEVIINTESDSIDNIKAVNLYSEKRNKLNEKYIIGEINSYKLDFWKQHNLTFSYNDKNYFIQIPDIIYDIIISSSESIIKGEPVYITLEFSDVIINKEFIYKCPKCGNEMKVLITIESQLGYTKFEDYYDLPKKKIKAKCPRCGRVLYRRIDK